MFMDIGDLKKNQEEKSSKKKKVDDDGDDNYDADDFDWSSRYHF